MTTKTDAPFTENKAEEPESLLALMDQAAVWTEYATALMKKATALKESIDLRLQARKLPWNKIPQDSRADVLPFLAVMDNGRFNNAMADKVCRPDYLLSHHAHLPAYDAHVYTDEDNFRGLRWVMKRGIKLGTLRMRVGWCPVETHRDRVLFWLVEKQHADIAREFVKVNSDVEDVSGGGSNSRTLVLAAQNGCVEVIQALVAAGADFNKFDIWGCTPMSRASVHGRLKAVQALLAAGADVNRASKAGTTPICYASENGHLEVVQALIAAGADVNQASDNGYGRTPISWASHRGYLQIVQALIAAGADVDRAYDHGYTPISCASGKDYLEIVQALTEAGARDCE